MINCFFLNHRKKSEIKHLEYPYVRGKESFFYPLLQSKSVYFFQARQGPCLKKGTHQAPSKPPAMRPPTSARTDNIRGIPGGNMFHQNLFLCCSSLSHQSSQTGDRKAGPQMFLRQNSHNLEELRNLVDQDQV